MKSTAQLGVSALALFGLLAGVASHATNLAELPLKASVLAKPNVIFGMDDSGSMDSELMLYNNDGAFWWDFNARSGWGLDAAHPNAALRGLTSTWFNAAGNADAQWRKLVYLFPNSTGAGNRVYSDASNDHFAVMPTTPFAFLRWSGVYYDNVSASYKSAPSNPALSPVHNPIYYNPIINYTPWAPAQLSGGAVVPVNAVAATTRSHPIYGASTFNLTANIALSTANDTVFTALPGMRVPAGSQKSVCSSSNAACAGWVNVAAEEAAAVGSVTRVAMAYYPATYWVKETCIPQNSNIATDSCTTAPDGSTLKRYEIKNGNTFPSGRSYAAEMQNFANWFQYHRKRKLMLAGAMGDTMEGLTGMRLGVIPFNNLSGNVTMYDADAAAAANNRLRVAGIFYEANGSGGTPTRETLKYIGEQFKRTDITGGKYNVIQFACQRNNAFIVTDGFANASAVTMPAWDAGKSAATWGTGAPYATTYDGTLADLALRYYTNNPRPPTDVANGMAAGALNATPTDTNTTLHMNTYGLTLGARGTLFLSESTPPPNNAAAWPIPSSNRSPTSVDDLWHATINGRGKMYLATTPEETALRIRAGLDDILSQEGAQGGIAVSAVNLDRSDSQAYLGVYNPRGWAGDLTANPININTAAVGALPNWSAAAVLAARDWNTRIVFTSSGALGVDFTAGTVGATVNPDTVSFTNQVVVDYLRGSRTGEGDTVRARNSLIGAVVNAEPVLARDERMVYLASGDGMLHAFDTLTGAEQWAYAPPDTLANLGKSLQRGWVYQTLLDATPTYARLTTGRKLLVGGLGAAGRSYYALDVTTPRGITAAQAQAQFKWVFPAAGDAANRANMGYTTGRPVIARTAADGNVVLVTSGYDNGLAIGDGRGRLWMLNANTGAVIKTFRTTVGSAGNEAGLAAVAAFKESDGMVRYVYGGDLLGHVWRFDLTAAGAGEINGELLASLKDAAGNAQPVTATPELAMVAGKRVVLVGTGRLLDVTDFGSGLTQSFYAIAEGANLPNARSGLVRQTYTRATDTLSANAVNWATDRGWYVDLPAGEQANTDPIVAYGAVAFVTNVNGGSNCAQSSFMYLVDIGTGTKVADSTFVSQTIATNATSSRVITLRVVNGKIIGVAHRSDNGVYQRELPLGQVIRPAKNSWKEIRR